MHLAYKPEPAVDLDTGAVLRIHPRKAAAGTADRPTTSGDL
jgi:hypothetical protein